MQDFHMLLRQHRSIRSFSNEHVTDDDVEDIVISAQCASTSSHIQATTVIRVRDTDSLKQIAEAANNQRQITEAPVFLVWCADMHRIGLACEMAEGDMISGMTEQFISTTVVVALAAQNAVIAAEGMGLGVCYIGAIRNNPQVVTEILELPKHVYPVFGLCIGHPAEDPETKPRLPVKLILKEERYDDHNDRELIADYDETMNNYYQKRTNSKKVSTWSKVMARRYESERRPHMRDFLRNRGFEMR